jgi:hypothetical protein
MDGSGRYGVDTHTAAEVFSESVRAVGRLAASCVDGTPVQVWEQLVYRLVAKATDVSKTDDGSVSIMHGLIGMTAAAIVLASDRLDGLAALLPGPRGGPGSGAVESPAAAVLRSPTPPPR